MNRFFLRKGIFAIIAMSVLSIAFFGCFHDSDDDDDDDATTSSYATADYALLKGAYLDGLQEVTIPIELNSTALSALSKGYDASGFFSAETSSSRFARSVGSSFASDFKATVSKATESGITLSFSGKTSALDYLFSLIATIPAAYTASGSAATRTAITLSVGSASTIPETSIDIANGTIPTKSELKGKTFKYVKGNSKDGIDIVYYVFNSDGSSATQKRFKEGKAKDPYTAPYNETTGYLGLYHHEDEADHMYLKKVGNTIYFYDKESEYSAESSSSLFTKYNLGGGSYIVLSSDGSASGYYTDTKDGVTTTGNYTGTFVNNGGVITMYIAAISNGEEIFALEDPCIYTGSELTTGGVFAEYLGEVPSN